MEWQLMTKEQKDITGIIRNFLEKELAPVVPEHEEKSEFPMEVLKRSEKLGFGGWIFRQNMEARALICRHCP